MVERWAIMFGDLLVVIGITILLGLVNLPLWLAILAIVLGVAGVAAGLTGGEAPARNYFQVMAAFAGLSLIMSLGAVLAGAGTLLGVPLTTGSFVLFVLVVATTFFAGFEPEAIEESLEERMLATQN